MNKSASSHQLKSLSKKEQQKQLVGLEGWLALFVVGFFISIVITTFNFFYGGFMSSLEFNLLNEYQSGLGDYVQVVAAIESVALATYIAMMIATLVLLLKRRALAKPFAIATLSFGAIYTTLDYFFASSIIEEADLLQDEYARAAIKTASEYAGRNIFSAAIWIPYFLISKRVARTLQASSVSINKSPSHDSNDSAKSSMPSFDIQYVAIPIVVLAATGILVVLSGGSLFETWEKTDREYKPETFRTEYTGRNNISYSEDRICGNGEDYNGCVNQHIAVYNSSCAHKTLTTSASDTCDNLLNFINQTKSTLQGCGYNCRTIADSSGKWGWQYLELLPETQQVSNGDQQDAITHTAVCFVRAGILKIGECE